jgi:hypothetical protein
LRRAGVLKTAMIAMLGSTKYRDMPRKPAVDISKAVSVADAVRFHNKFYGTNFSASMWRAFHQYKVPPAVVNKLFANKQKKTHYEILKANIMEAKDEDGNLVFNKSEIYTLDTDIARTLRLQLDDAAAAAAAAAMNALPDDPKENAAAAEPPPVSANATETPDKPEQRSSKRQKN